MNSLRAQELEGSLVKIITHDGYEVIDTIKYVNNGEIQLESYNLWMEDSDIKNIIKVKNDILPLKYLKYSRIAFIQSNYSN